MNRRDYAFPFRIDAASGQAATTDYASHVEQMVRQVLLTSPGERADLPDFGCGLRRLIFAPLSDALVTTVQLVTQQSLNRWLAGQITVQKVDVSAPDGGAAGTLLVEILYILIETQTPQRVRVLVN